ncbi:MAG: DNA methylase, partial [Oscillospiraceae bacterium]|nr:DNA methylase [Oscillospiraceae bacterium]
MERERKKQFIAIDLKSFYASVECAERGLDPLDANLVVADESRTDKTICLAVSPALKALGIPGRPRLFEVKQRLKEVNRERRSRAPRRQFTGKSIYASELSQNPSLELDLVIAPPRMRYYMDYSRNVVEIYLRYVSIDDLLIYSVDEVFIDATHYLDTYAMTAHDFTRMLIRQVLGETRITATAGIGTNLYLAKIAMDIVAKHIPADADGVRIAELDERSYREQLWSHRPLTDFWRVGRGIARKLERNGMYTMGDVAR